MYQGEGRFFIIATITDHKVCVESTFPYSNFIEYIVILETKLKSWNFNRRYSHFEALHNDLTRKFANLPAFPEKRFFNKKDWIINERKVMLTEYLNFFLHKTNFTSNSALLEFLEIEKEFIMLLIKYPTTINNKTLNKSALIEKEELARKAKSNDKEKDILKFFFTNSKISMNSFDNDGFLLKLNHNPIDDLINILESSREDICENVNKFWSKLKRLEVWPSFSKNDIIKLFFGSKNPKNKNGLIELIWTCF